MSCSISICSTVLSRWALVASARSSAAASSVTRPALRRLSSQSARPAAAAASSSSRHQHCNHTQRQQQQEQQRRSLASVASSAPPSSHLPTVALLPDQHKVSITWASGLQSKFHNVWLRDHCRCPNCYHPITKQRLLNTFAIPENISPEAIEATTEGLQVTWPSAPSATSASSETEESQQQQHVSLYPWRWLMNNSYAPVLSRTTSSGSSAGAGLAGITGDVAASHSGIGSAGAGGEYGRILWGRGIAASPPTVPYDEVMASEQGVLKWCNKIAQYGFSFVSGIPPTPEATQALIERIAFIRPTHYGGFWDFTSNLAHGDTAYTNLALGAHTDTTYFTDPAGLQLFHLLSHTRTEGSSENEPQEKVGPQGGESLLVDGFLAAKVLREVHPDAYRTLSRVRVRTHSAGDDATLVRPLLSQGYPILQHEAPPDLRRFDEELAFFSGEEQSASSSADAQAAPTGGEKDEPLGELVMVRYNNDDRSTLRVRDEDVEPFYDALRKWHAILSSADGEYWSQLVPGTAVIFDNHRVLHGRAAFVGARRLCGAYVSHDDYRSRLSVLRAQYPAAEVSAAAAAAAAAAKTNNTSSPAPPADAASSQRYHRGVWDDAL